MTYSKDYTLNCKDILRILTFPFTKTNNQFSKRFSLRFAAIKPKNLTDYKYITCLPILIHSKIVTSE